MLGVLKQLSELLGGAFGRGLTADGGIKVCPTPGLRPIRLLRLPGQDTEYWVSEMQADLPPDTKFVISPVAGFVGDGNDHARHRRLADD